MNLQTYRWVTAGAQRAHSGPAHPGRMTSRHGFSGRRRHGAAAVVALLVLGGCGTATDRTSSPPVTSAATSATVVSVGGVTDVSTYATWADPRITESSSLTRVGDHLITVNDSGDPAVLYVSTGTSGQITGTITYADAAPDDVEALATSPDGTIWVGDIGDNARARSTIVIYRLPPITQWDGDTTVTAQRYEFAYPDGAHDAETLLVQPDSGDLFVVTKDASGGVVYAVPTLDATRTVTLEKVAQVAATVTDGVFDASGEHVLLRTYGEVTAYGYPGFQQVATATLPAEPKGEGLTLGPDAGTYLTATEGAGTPVLRWRWTV